MDSSSAIQREQMLGLCQFLLLKLSHVRIGLLITNYRKALTFNGALTFHVSLKKDIEGPHH